MPETAASAPETAARVKKGFGLCKNAPDCSRPNVLKRQEIEKKKDQLLDDWLLMEQQEQAKKPEQSAQMELSWPGVLLLTLSGYHSECVLGTGAVVSVVWVVFYKDGKCLECLGR